MSGETAPSRAQAGVAAALGGAFLLLGLHETQRLLLDPALPTWWTLLGALVGLLLGLSARGGGAGATLGGVGAGLLLWLFGSGGWGAALIALGLGNAVALLGRQAARHLGGSASLGLAAVAGGAVLLAARGVPLPSPLWVGLAWLLGLFVLRRSRGIELAETPRPAVDGSALLAGAAILRLGAAGVVGAALLALVPAADAEGGLTRGLLGASVTANGVVSLGLGLGLLAGAGLGFLQGPRTGVVAELLGWGTLALLTSGGPRFVAGEGSWVVGLLFVSALPGGLALAGPIQRRGAALAWTALLAAGASLPLGQALLDAAQQRWDPADQAALALGTGAGADEPLRRASEEEAVRVRFAAAGPPAVHVLDVRQGEKRVRLLALDGQVTGRVPTRRRGPNDVMAAEVLQAALPFLVSEAPRRVLLLGLGTGVSAGTLLRTDVREVIAVEPRAGVVAIHDDPGDPFGFVSRRPLNDPRLVLAGLTPTRALREFDPEDWDALLAADPDLSLERLVAHAATLKRPTAWRLSRFAPAALAPVAARCFAFRPTTDALVLLVLPQPRRLAVAELRRRWDAHPRLDEALSEVGLETPLELLGFLVAGPAGIRAAAEEHGEARIGGGELAAIGAVHFLEELDFGAEAATAAPVQASLATRLAKLGSPAALPLARAAVATRESPGTLQVLGDLLFGLGEEEEAEQTWARILELDPRALQPRISLARGHEARKEWKAGRELLEAALGQDPARDPELHYRIGRLALGERDPVLAHAHLKKAGDYPGAADLAALAANQAGPEALRPKLSLEQKLDAANLLLDRARAARDEAEARERHAAALAVLEPLAREAQLPADARKRLARLFQRAVAERPPPRQPQADAVLERLRAELLAPLAAGDPLVAVERAEALAGAGEPEAGEAILLELAAGAGARLPEVQRALGELSLAQGKPAAAVVAFERCLALSQGSSLHTRVYLRLADAQRAARRPERAVRALQDAERLYPGHPRVRLNLGTLLWELGRKGEALAAYEGFLEVAPPRHPLREQVQRLVDQERRPPEEGR